MNLPKRLTAALVTAFAVACATGPSGPRAPDVRTEARGDANVITEAELAPLGAQPLRQAIERLRPRFLRGRGPSSITQQARDVTVVYVGSARMGSIEVLDQIRANEVREVRYLSATDASQRFGTNHTSGAIVITLR